MPGLSVSELPPETLYAGDVIEYYARAFLCGGKRGHRFAIVLRIVDAPDEDLPVSLDTGEALPLTNLMRRRVDRFGNHLDLAAVTWRKLRSYTLIAGSYDASTRAGALCEALAAAVRGATEATIAQQHIIREGSECYSMEQSEGSTEKSQENMSAATSSRAPSVTTSSQQDLQGGEITSMVSEPSHPREEKSPATPPSSPGKVIDLVSPDLEQVRVSTCKEPTCVAITGGAEALASGDACEQSRDSEAMVLNGDHAVTSTPTDLELLDVKDYMKTVPTRWMRNKLRHQAKQKSGKLHVSRYRKRRHQAMGDITRSGTQIYHARTLKARKVKQLLRLPGVKTRLQSLHARRPVYAVADADTRLALPEVSWPAGVRPIQECEVPEGLSFPDIGEYDMCRCVGDCFMDSCDNVGSAVYCTPDTCKLGASCSNAPRIPTTLKLFDTRRVGLGVYTTTDLDVGDVVGGYIGRLCEYDAVVQGQPKQAVKMNIGYPMLYNTKSASNKYVYMEALNCGSITRFINLACKPNAAFVEMQNRSSVKVLVKMIKDVKAGAEITVNYGDEIWCTCACDDCWIEKEDTEGA